MDNRGFISDVKSDNLEDNRIACSQVSQNKDGVELKRRMGLLSGVSLIVGSMIGSGIFISPGGVLQRSGSVGLSLVVWTACGLLTICGSLCYVELGVLIPKSGGDYSYFLDGFKHLHPFWGPLPAFLYSWTTVILLQPASVATVSLSLAQYVVSPLVTALDVCPNPENLNVLVKLTAALCLFIICYLNCYSVEAAIRVQNTFTAAKLIAIAIIIGCGICQLYLGRTEYLAEGFANSNTSFGTIATSFYGGLWAFGGWGSLNLVVEELKDPYVNLPRALMIGIPLVTILYLMLNISYLTVLSPTQIVTSPAVAVDFGDRMLGPMSFLIPLSVAMSVFGVTTGLLFTSGRLCYVSAREGHLVDVLSYVHSRKLSPSPALIFTSVAALAVMIPGSVESLIDFCGFTSSIFSALAMVVLILMRFTRKNQHRPYMVPIVFPLIVFVTSIYFVVFPIISNPALEYIYVLFFILFGVFVYTPLVYYQKTPKFMEMFTRFFQKLLNVVPTKMVDQ